MAPVGTFPPYVRWRMSLPAYLRTTHASATESAGWTRSRRAGEGVCPCRSGDAFIQWRQALPSGTVRRWTRHSTGSVSGNLPKGLDLSGISQAKLNAIARPLNERPRKTLGYETPAERYRQCVASTG